MSFRPKHPWSQCNAFLTHESPETTFKAKSISDYHGIFISSWIVVKAFRSEGLEPKTLKWHRVIRHALLSNYGLLIAQDCFVSRKRRRVSRNLLLSPTFPKIRFELKYIKDLCRVRIQTMTCVQWRLQRPASPICLELRTNCPKHGSWS